jgi:hypothetical protein
MHGESAYGWGGVGTSGQFSSHAGAAASKEGVLA